MKNRMRLVAACAVVLGGVVLSGRVDADPARLEAADVQLVEAAGALPLPVVPAGAHPFVATAQGTQVIDDFESAPWPSASAAPHRWVSVSDLNGAVGGTFTWGRRNCQASGGGWSLWGIGGGADGGSLGCGAAYGDQAASSALLYLDLAALRSAESLELVFDVWADAGPTDGFLINYLEFGPTGSSAARRNVYSATGYARAWSQGIPLNLRALHDRMDPQWTADVRGQRVYFELLFISTAGHPPGEGIFLDDLLLRSTGPGVTAVPPATPTSASDVTVACGAGQVCGTLAVRAFVDSRCDGRLQPGVDAPVRSHPRVDVVAGSIQLGTTLSNAGSAYFRFPIADGAVARLSVPEGYAMCGNSPNPVALTAADFRPFGRKKIDFRVVRAP
jgi:hypothetical protein